MDVEDYREVLAEGVDDARDLANDARRKQHDPKPFVEMEFASNLAERCEKLLEEYGVDGLADRILELDEAGHGREEIAVRLADDFAEGRIGDYDSKEEMVDAAIRTAVALLTEGVVAAPIDGIGEITIEKNDDGSQFIRIPYFGPIRSAGGTGQALSILVADYIRQKLDISEFKPRDDEIERYVEELHLYDREVSLQYMPKDKETRHIIENCSVMVDGPGTTDGEVEGYRDLERIDGNQGRGGMCLVVGEGIAQKAPKLKKYTDSLGIDGWEWLNELSTVTSSESADEEEEEEEEEEDDEDVATDGGEYEFDGTYDEENEALQPSKKFVADLIAGRPVFSGPSATGGFRLRYGRSRSMGLAACGYHPATMVIFDKFLATGTQLKTERPGKAAGVAPVDSIEGPTVRLSNGEMRRIDDVEEAERVLNAVEEIIDVGEVAVPYGEFLENNHPLVPASYVHEWWIQEYEQAGGDPSDEAVTEENITAERAFDIAEEYDIPLHPKFTYLWDDISMDQYEALSEAIEIAQTGTDEGTIEYVGDIHRETLERLLVPHRWDKEHGRCYIDDDGVRRTLERCCSTDAEGDDVRDRVQDAAGIEVRERAPVRVGARMGRPEKSMRREVKTHVLFPIGDAGGNLRDIEKAAENWDDAEDTSYFGEDEDKHKPRKRGQAREEEENGKGLIHTQLANRRCPDCGEESWRPRCPDCDVRTDTYYECPRCGQEGEEGDECRCEAPFMRYGRKPLDVNTELAKAMKNVGERPTSFDTFKGVKGLSSKSKLPEPLEKGVLRAKYDLRPFRDGTVRYDMMDLPLTSFCANDIGVDVERLKDLGYEETIDGEPLTDPDDLVEIYPQDIILAEGCGEYMLKTANFIDELLVKYYDEEPFYDAETMDDLIGELILGLAPHTSAGVLGRIVGFTDASANFASPFFHAGKRRNCDGDEDAVMLLMDGLLNFSKQYLPDKRGKRTMDAPLVVSTVLDPLEVDDEAHNVDIVDEYPLDFYEQTYRIPGPKEYDMPIAEDITDDGMGFQHTLETSDISAGPTESEYKNPNLDMKGKTFAQLNLAKKTHAVEHNWVAETVIEKHFMPDIIGNLSAFARQSTRCPACNEKFRRIPLEGRCRNCRATNIILTVHEGSVNKYIGLVTEVVDEFDVSEYTEQRIEALSERIESLFEDDQNKQTDLGSFV